jgi:sugar lactone lactonase YvrE
MILNQASRIATSTPPGWKRFAFAALGVFVFLFALFLIFAGIIGLSSCSQPGAGSPAPKNGGNNGGGSGSGKYINTIAGNGSPGSIGDNGPATSAELNTPSGVFVDKVGYVYIADTTNSKIRYVDLSKNIFTAAGTGSPSYNGDGISPTTANLYWPAAVALDASGNMFISDSWNDRIREVTTLISTYAGNGNPTFAGDNGLATSASISFPNGICFDNAGNMYIADNGNHRVRLVTLSTGKISTVAGNGTTGYAGDNGPATSANLTNAYGVVVDGSGNLYISDPSNCVVRKVDSTGKITTYAGTGTPGGFSGDGGAANKAQLNSPTGLALDSSGNLYIADSYNNRIRMVDTSGNIKTVAGNGTAGFASDGTDATLGSLNTPLGVAVDSAGTLYIADTVNNVIRTVK